MIQLTQGDFGKKINIRIKNSRNEPVPLEGCHVTMDFLSPSRIKTSYDLPIIDPRNGIAQLTVNVEMTSKLGTGFGYIDIIDPTSHITLDELLHFEIRANCVGL